MDECLGCCGVGDGGKGFNVSTRNKTGRLVRFDHQCLGVGLCNTDQLLIQRFERCTGEHVGTGFGLVHVQPGDAFIIGVNGKKAIVHVPESSIGGRSSSMAPPWPPPIQRLAIPLRACCRSMIFSRCSTIRAPLAPTG